MSISAIAHADRRSETDLSPFSGIDALAQVERLLGWVKGSLHRAFVLERAEHQLVLQIVQPALAGMLDGSVSTLAPLFATALATRDSHTTFLVGLAAAVGAGISMAFAEALSDDGTLTGRGDPWLRGIVEGLATFAGGFGHTLPFLLPDVQTALPAASAVVAIELLLIAWVRFHYFRMHLVRSTLQVLAGGALVFVTGVLIGGA